MILSSTKQVSPTHAKFKKALNIPGLVVHPVRYDITSEHDFIGSDLVSYIGS